MSKCSKCKIYNMQTPVLSQLGGLLGKSLHVFNWLQHQQMAGSSIECVFERVCVLLLHNNGRLLSLDKDEKIWMFAIALAQN